MNAIIFSIVLAFFNSTSRPKTETAVQKNVDRSNIVESRGSLRKVIPGKLVLQISVQQFFKKGAITDIGYGETSLRYLMPLAFYKDSNYFYIPDRSRLSLNILDVKGKFHGSIKVPLKDFTFYKIDRVKSLWYFLDIEKGLSVLTGQSVLKHGDEKTVDFHVDGSDMNVYFENMLNEERALLDQNSVLKEPMKIDYLSSFINNSILFGITDKGENHYTIVRTNLKDNSELPHITFTAACDMCFIMPSFLDETHILSSIDNVAVNDQVSVINQSGTNIMHYTLEYPFKVDRLVSDVSASISYSGYMYYYDRRSNTLYSLCTDKESIRIFSFDLSSMD